MKNKKSVLILILVLLLIAAAVFIWTQCSGKDASAEGKDAGDAENQDVNDPNGAEAEAQAQLVESEGDLIITIPDDEESDGF